MKPWLWLPPRVGHTLFPSLIQALGSFRQWKTLTWQPFQWRGIEFTNPLGIAGGVDKNADCLSGWWSFGPGFIEVGTLTPRPQSANLNARIYRHHQRRALWNNLGFPNKGCLYVQHRLEKLKRPYFTPVLVSLSKNRQTALEWAATDIVECMKQLQQLASIFVMNISSPNTAQLRTFFQDGEKLTQLLIKVMECRQRHCPHIPILLKLSPDLGDDELKRALDVSVAQAIDGWILTNTTTQNSEDLGFPKGGGVSGAPLTALAKEKLYKTIEHLGSERFGRLIISCGGVLSAADVFERLRMGADLVQVYSAVVFDGPLFFQHVFEQRTQENPPNIQPQDQQQQQRLTKDSK